MLLLYLCEGCYCLLRMHVPKPLLPCLPLNKPQTAGMLLLLLCEDTRSALESARADPAPEAAASGCWHAAPVLVSTISACATQHNTHM